MFKKSLTGARHINADTITTGSIKSTHIVDEDGLSFGSSIQTSNLIDNDKELLSTLKPLGTAGTGTYNTISPHGVGDRANDCVIVFEHDITASAHHFISAKLLDNIIKIDKIHADVLGTTANNSATKLLKTDDAYAQFHSTANQTSGKWTFTTEPVYLTGGVEYILQHGSSDAVVGHHADDNASSLHPKIGSTGSAWVKSNVDGVASVQYIVVNDANGQLKTETKKPTYHKLHYKPSNYSASEILVVAGNDIHKASPYFILTTDTDGKILGKYLWDSAFNMFSMGSSAGGADARPSGDQYKQGLVPEGSATHNNTYLRKDGVWGTPIDTDTDTNTFVNPTSVVALGGISNGTKISDDDADNTFEFGRIKIGYIDDLGFVDVASFSHRDNFTTTSYALVQTNLGATHLNAKNGTLINFRVNGALCATISADTSTFSTNIFIDASHYLSLQSTSGTLLTSNDNDTIFEFGRGKLGYNGADGDEFTIAHRDNFSNVNYALKQNAVGDTFLNAKTGRNILVAINDGIVCDFDANDTTFSSNAIIDASHTLSLLKTSGSILTTTDNDTIFELGRGKLGFNGTNSDEFCIAHRDMMTSTNYALRQKADGSLNINAPTGKEVVIKVNNTNVVRFNGTNTIHNANLQINSGHILDILRTSGSVLTSTDNDTIWEMGRCKIGYAGNSDEFSIGHRDNFTSANCALTQDEVGATYLNAKSGQLVKIGINDTPVIELSATEVVYKSKIEFSGFTSGTNFLISDGSAQNNNNWLECGGLKIGYWTGGGTYGALYYKGITASNSYTFLTDNATTYINATTYVYLLTGGVVKLRVYTNEIRYYVGLISNSDIRIKGEIEDLDDCWDAFKSIKVKKYKKILKDSSDKFRIGVIADDIEVNDNELIKNAFSAGVEDPKNLTELKDGTKIDAVKAVEYEQLYRMSMVVVQQLQERVERLEQIIINNNLV